MHLHSTECPSLNKSSPVQSMEKEKELEEKARGNVSSWQKELYGNVSGNVASDRKGGFWGGSLREHAPLLTSRMGKERVAREQPIREQIIREWTRNYRLDQARHLLSGSHWAQYSFFQTPTISLITTQSNQHSVSESFFSLWIVFTDCLVALERVHVSGPLHVRDYRVWSFDILDPRPISIANWIVVNKATSTLRSLYPTLF